MTSTTSPTAPTSDTEVLLDFTISTTMFRNALTACLPHVPAAKDFPELARIRCYVEYGVVWIAATDRRTVGLAAVPFGSTALATPTEGVIDLSAADAKKVLAVFPALKDGEGSGWLRVQLIAGPAAVTNTHVPDATTGDADASEEDLPSTSLRVTDVSGIFSGDELELPAKGVEEKFPNLPVMVSSLLRLPIDDGAVGFSTDDDTLSRFRTAIRSYAQNPVVWMPQGCHLLVWQFGPDFIGLSPATRYALDADYGNLQVPAHVEVTRGHRAAWLNELPAAAGSAETALSVWQATHVPKDDDEDDDSPDLDTSELVNTVVETAAELVDAIANPAEARDFAAALLAAAPNTVIVSDPASRPWQETRS